MTAASSAWGTSGRQAPEVPQLPRSDEGAADPKSAAQTGK